MKHSIFEPRDMKATIETGEWKPENWRMKGRVYDPRERVYMRGEARYRWQGRIVATLAGVLSAYFFVHIMWWAVRGFPTGVQ